MPTKAPPIAKKNGEQQSSSGTPTAVVVATLDELHCGLPVSAVLEITRSVAITPLPSAPRGVEGVVDYHGEVIPVIDLRDRLGLPPRPVHPSEHFIIANTGARTVGMRVDAAAALLEVAAADIVAAERVIQGARPVAGIARTPKGLVLLQDMSAMLSQAEEERLRGAMAGVDSPASNA